MEVHRLLRTEPGVLNLVVVEILYGSIAGQRFERGALAVWTAMSTGPTATWAIEARPGHVDGDHGLQDAAPAEDRPPFVGPLKSVVRAGFFYSDGMSLNTVEIGLNRWSRPRPDSSSPVVLAARLEHNRPYGGDK